MKKLVILLFSVFLFSSVSAAAIDNIIPIQIQTTDSSGNVITGTFEFTINVSNSSGCETENVLYSNVTTMATDNRGIVTYSLENVNLNFDKQYWFCYYRDGKLKQNVKLGRTPYSFNSKYLGGYDENFFAPLNTSLTGDFNIQGSLFINGIDALNGSSEDTIPLNTVIFYNGTACPQGFDELTDAQGRYLVGTPSGGTLGAQVGTALTDSENRAVGQHNHSVTDPGHQHQQRANNGGSSLTANVQTTTSSRDGVNPDGNTASATTGITINNTGDVAGTNAPYVQYLTCIKTSTVDLTAGWNQDTSSIWVADTALSAIIGATSKVANEMLRVVGDSLFEGNLNVTGNITNEQGHEIGGMRLIETQTASNDPFINFTTGIDDTYTNYVLIGNSVVPTKDSVDAFFRVSVSGTFKSELGDYGWNIHETTTNAGHAIFSDTSDTAGKISHSDTGSAVNEGINFKAMIFRSDGNVNNHIKTEYSNEVSTGPLAQGNSIIRTAGTIDSTPIDGIQFFFSSENIESGTFKLYGVK